MSSDQPIQPHQTTYSQDSSSYEALEKMKRSSEESSSYEAHEDYHRNDGHPDDSGNRQLSRTFLSRSSGENNQNSRQIQNAQKTPYIRAEQFLDKIIENEGEEDQFITQQKVDQKLRSIGIQQWNMDPSHGVSYQQYGERPGSEYWDSQDSIVKLDSQIIGKNITGPYELRILPNNYPLELLRLNKKQFIQLYGPEERSRQIQMIQDSLTQENSDKKRYDQNWDYHNIQYESRYNYDPYQEYEKPSYYRQPEVQNGMNLYEQNNSDDTLLIQTERQDGIYEDQEPGEIIQLNEGQTYQSYEQEIQNEDQHNTTFGNVNDEGNQQIENVKMTKSICEDSYNKKNYNQKTPKFQNGSSSEDLLNSGKKARVKSLYQRDLSSHFKVFKQVAEYNVLAQQIAYQSPKKLQQKAKPQDQNEKTCNITASLQKSIFCQQNTPSKPAKKQVAASTPKNPKTLLIIPSKVFQSKSQTSRSESYSPRNSRVDNKNKKSSNKKTPPKSPWSSGTKRSSSLKAKTSQKKCYSEGEITCNCNGQANKKSEFREKIKKIRVEEKRKAQEYKKYYEDKFEKGSKKSLKFQAEENLQDSDKQLEQGAQKMFQRRSKSQSPNKNRSPNKNYQKKIQNPKPQKQSFLDLRDKLKSQQNTAYHSNAIRPQPIEMNHTLRAEISERKKLFKQNCRQQILSPNKEAKKMVQQQKYISAEKIKHDEWKKQNFRLNNDERLENSHSNKYQNTSNQLSFSNMKKSAINRLNQSQMFVESMQQEFNNLIQIFTTKVQNAANKKDIKELEMLCKQMLKQRDIIGKFLKFEYFKQALEKRLGRKVQNPIERWNRWSPFFNRSHEYLTEIINLAFQSIEEIERQNKFQIKKSSQDKQKGLTYIANPFSNKKYEKQMTQIDPKTQQKTPNQKNKQNNRHIRNRMDDSSFILDPSIQLSTSIRKTKSHRKDQSQKNNHQPKSKLSFSKSLLKSKSNHKHSAIKQEKLNKKSKAEFDQSESLTEQKLKGKVSSARLSFKQAKKIISHLMEKNHMEEIHYLLSELHQYMDQVEEGMKIARFERKVMSKNFKKAKRHIMFLRTAFGPYEGTIDQLTSCLTISDRKAIQFYLRQLKQTSEQRKRKNQSLKYDDLLQYYLDHNQESQSLCSSEPLSVNVESLKNKDLNVSAENNSMRSKKRSEQESFRSQKININDRVQNLSTIQRENQKSGKKSNHEGQVQASFYKQWCQSSSKQQKIPANLSEKRSNKKIQQGDVRKNTSPPLNSRTDQYHQSYFHSQKRKIHSSSNKNQDNSRQFFRKDEEMNFSKGSQNRMSPPNQNLGFHEISEKNQFSQQAQSILGMRENSRTSQINKEQMKREQNLQEFLKLIQRVQNVTFSLSFESSQSQVQAFRQIEKEVTDFKKSKNPPELLESTLSRQIYLLKKKINECEYFTKYRREMQRCLGESQQAFERDMWLFKNDQQDFNKLMLESVPNPIVLIQLMKYRSTTYQQVVHHLLVYRITLITSYIKICMEHCNFFTLSIDPNSVAFRVFQLSVRDQQIRTASQTQGFRFESSANYLIQQMLNMIIGFTLPNFIRNQQFNFEQFNR